MALLINYVYDRLALLTTVINISSDTAIYVLAQLPFVSTLSVYSLTTFMPLVLAIISSFVALFKPSVSS